MKLQEDRRQKLESLNVAIPVIPGLKEDYLKEALVAVLYQKGDITLKQAREIVGQTRRDFEEKTLAKFGFTTLRNNPANTTIEIEASERA